MPASKTNYISIHKNDSQVYGATSKTTLLESPPPANSILEDRIVFFITYQPDNEVLSVHRLPSEEVMAANIKYPKNKRDVGEDGNTENG